MSPKEQRIAIAEEFGFKGCTDSKCDYRKCQHLHKDGKAFFPEPYSTPRYPDYLNDLNAMHEAEQWLIGQDKSFMSSPQLSDQYEYWLCMVVLKRRQWENGCWKGERKDTLNVAIATAAQRAEAFLRTTGLWKD